MKRISAFLLGLALLVLPSSATPSDPWPAWAEEALSWGREQAVSQEFLAAPSTIVTRGMAAQLLYEAAGRPPVSEVCPFSDVSGVYAGAVTWAAEQGYLTGVGNGTYEPSRSVTRQEFAAILWRRAGSPGAAVQNISQFQDVDAVEAWARTAVLWSLQAGVMGGRGSGVLAPNGGIPVAEALVMLERAASLSDLTGLGADLAALTASPRPIGSQGEADAAQYLRSRIHK